MAEAARILAGIASGQPVNAAELATARDDMSLGLSSAWATNNGIGQYLLDQQAYDLPDDDSARYPASVGALSLAEANAEGAGLIGHRPLTWVGVGDRARIDAGVRQRRLGQVLVVEQDRQPLRNASAPG